MLDVVTLPMLGAALAGSVLSFIYTVLGLFVFSSLDGPKYRKALHKTTGNGAVFVIFALLAWPWVALQVVTLHKRLFKE